MERDSDYNSIAKSEIYKTYYGFEALDTPLMFKPFNLMSSSKFNLMIESNKTLLELNNTSDGKSLLDNLRLLLVKDIPLPSGTDTATMSLSEAEDNFTVSFHELELITKLVKPSINFLFKHEDKLYGLSSTTFKNSLKRNCLDEETKKIKSSAVKDLVTDLDENPGNLYGCVKLYPIGFTLGKILTALLPSNTKQSVISYMVTFINSSKEISPTEYDPHIHEIESNLITYYYNVKNYARGHEGTPLGNSCMRGSENTNQITFYEDNPNAVRMIVYIDNEKKLAARALLWKTITGNYVVDRIYYISSNTAVELAKYCKIKGYNTCYQQNANNYALPMEDVNNVIVQLDQLENREHQPYYDSMKFVDIINNLVARNSNSLAKYNNSLQRDYVILKLDSFQPGNLHGRDYWDDESLPMSIKGVKKQAIIRDAKGRELESFRNITIVQRPFKGLMPANRVVKLLPDEIPVTSSYVKEMIRRYNCIRTVLVVDKDIKYRLSDKKDTLYSTFHDSHILKRDSIFIKSINGYALKQIHDYPKFHDKLKTIKVKRLYVNKLVSVRAEGIKYLQEQFALIPGKISLSSIRPSRVFMTKASNITATSIMLKGIPVPIKYIKIIKNKTNGQN